MKQKWLQILKSVFSCLNLYIVFCIDIGDGVGEWEPVGNMSQNSFSNIVNRVTTYFRQKVSPSLPVHNDAGHLFVSLVENVVCSAHISCYFRKICIEIVSTKPLPIIFCLGLIMKDPLLSFVMITSILCLPQMLFWYFYRNKITFKGVVRVTRLLTPQKLSIVTVFFCYRCQELGNGWHRLWCDTPNLHMWFL